MWLCYVISYCKKLLKLKEFQKLLYKNLYLTAMNLVGMVMNTPSTGTKTLNNKGTKLTG